MKNSEVTIKPARAKLAIKTRATKIIGRIRLVPPFLWKKEAIAFSSLSISEGLAFFISPMTLL